MSKKQDLRKQLDAGLAVFFAGGGQITKVPANGTRKPRKQEDEVEFVEIEVEALPPELQKKFFPEG